MCEYCGCRDIALIGRLSNEHYGAVDDLGNLRRAIETGQKALVDTAAAVMGDHLFPHNLSEEAGLFHELLDDEYFAPTVADLIEEHHLMVTQVNRIAAGEWTVYPEFENSLRGHIDKEENGLFPACAVYIDADTWVAIDELMR